MSVLEEAPRVQRRHQFFVWTQNQLQTLLPHRALVCGSYHRQRRKVLFHVFHNVVLTPTTLSALTDGDGALLQEAMRAWIGGGGHALAVTREMLSPDARKQAHQIFADSQSEALLLHGVARPQRLAEIETLFLFSTDGGRPVPRQLQLLDILMPHVHSTWRRVEAVERDLQIAPARQAQALPSKLEMRRLVTDRERQILLWMREGKSNPQIGELLSISPLTVKNHVQKILRKLNAANRAQAVAHAISMNLLLSDDSQFDMA